MKGQPIPATIYAWWLVGVPLHALAGLLVGRLLQDRLQSVRQGVRLLGSLVVFEMALTASMAAFTKSSLWLEVWKMPAGW